MARWLCQLGFQGFAHYCITLIYHIADFNNWQVSLIVHLFPVFYTDITTPDLMKPLKCLPIKPVTLYIYKKSIKIKIICSLSMNITENMAYTGGLGGSFSIIPIPKAEYRLLGSIFSFHTTLLASFISFFRWIVTYKLLNHAPPRFRSLFRILIPESLINLELKKMLSLPHTPDPEQVVLHQLILTFLCCRDFTTPALLSSNI